MASEQGNKTDQVSKHHVVLWTAGGRCYVVPTSHVVEVVPVVKVEPEPRTPDWMIGWMNYRENLIPTIDMPALLGHGKWTPRLASRILVVAPCGGIKRDVPCTGLLVEIVLESEILKFSESIANSGQLPERAAFLGPIVMTDKGAVQWVYPDAIHSILQCAED